MSPYLDRAAPEKTRAALIAHLARKLRAPVDHFDRACAVLGVEDLVDCLLPDPDAARARLHDALVARDPSASPEAKKITHDGAIWPLARSAMTDARLIAERMAEDIITLARESADARVLDTHLALRGWLWQQIKAHGPAAIDLANAALGLEDAA